MSVYEPKYKLNRVDGARWRELLARDCAQLPRKPGGKVKPDPRYPPVTPREQAEFEKLSRKRSHKIESHPKVQESLEYGRRQNRKLQRLLRRAKALLARLKKANQKTEQKS